jgi:hypothetical protein
MRSPHRIAIAVLFTVTASNAVFAYTSFDNRVQAPIIVNVLQSSLQLLPPDALKSSAARSAPGSAAQTAATESTSEPPGPGSPRIPGGPGPLPDDDDDDDDATPA